MDRIDWKSSPESKIIELPAFHVTANGRNAMLVQRLQEENGELRIRIGALIRILMERGVFSAADYAAMVLDTQAKASAV